MPKLTRDKLITRFERCRKIYELRKEGLTFKQIANLTFNLTSNGLWTSSDKIYLKRNISTSRARQLYEYYVNILNSSYGRKFLKTLNLPNNL